MLVECELCSSEIKAKNYNRHQNQYCAFRIVQCPYQDCREEFKARDERDHYKFSCESDFNPIRRKVHTYSICRRGYSNCRFMIAFVSI